MNEFRRLIAGPEPVYAPLVFNPVSALLAQAAGFRALYQRLVFHRKIDGVRDETLLARGVVQFERALQARVVDVGRQFHARP